jgi:hypothetical protein
MFIGDCAPGYLWVGSQVVYIPMSTAIAMVYTNEGFVMGADGRKRRSDGEILTDSAQKVFPIDQSGVHVAYALAGSVGMTPNEHDTTVVFDFVTEIANALPAAHASGAKTLHDFVVALCAGAEAKLSDLKASGGIEKLPSDELTGESVICRIFFNGYYRGTPGRVFATFFHDNQIMQPTNVSDQPLYPGTLMGYGSKLIAEMLGRSSKSGTWIDSYRFSPRNAKAVLRSEGISMVKANIMASSDSRAVELDPTACKGIGGHMVVATVTRKEGFRWLKGYEPRTETTSPESSPASSSPS